ncbi:MAG: FtsW/RodA/SpoVE family cell cycle protein [candidate division WOR-3 bacterium]
MVFIALLLSIIGIIEIWTIDKAIAQKQALFVIFAILLGYIIYKYFKPSFIRILFYPLLIITVFLLILAHFSSDEVNRWIYLKFFYLQPSEISKIVLAFMFYLYNPKENFLKVSFIVILIFLLILTQPDLGFAIAIAFVSFMIFYYSEVNRNLLLFIIFSIVSIISSFKTIIFMLSFFALILLIYITKSKWYWSIISILTFIFFGVITPIIWNKVLKPYQKARIVAFLNPEVYKEKEAYQLYQAQIAIGSGKIFGKGYNKGTQKKYNFLPIAHTDFIFSAICEDFGFLGGFFVITLIFILILRMLIIFLTIEDEQLRRFTLTLILFFIYSFIVNISVNLGIMPTKGYPLLFLSYGGSHTILDYICLFLIMWIKKYSTS